MTTKRDRKKRLILELMDREYRDEYISSSVDVGVAFQIRTLRDQRNWNQTELAKRAKMYQERISVLENPSYSPTLATLKKLASAFDVGLMVRFVPISKLVKYELNLDSTTLEVPSFDQENYFKESHPEDAASDLLGNYYGEDPMRQEAPEPRKQLDNKVIDLSSRHKENNGEKDRFSEGYHEAAIG